MVETTNSFDQSYFQMSNRDLNIPDINHVPFMSQTAVLFLATIGRPRYLKKTVSLFIFLSTDLVNWHKLQLLSTKIGEQAFAD